MYLIALVHLKMKNNLRNLFFGSLAGGGGVVHIYIYISLSFLSLHKYMNKLFVLFSFVEMAEQSLVPQ